MMECPRCGADLGADGQCIKKCKSEPIDNKKVMAKMPAEPVDSKIGDVIGTMNVNFN